MMHGQKIIKLHILLPVFFFFENRTVYVIMWENNEKPYRPQMTIWRMRIACRTPKATGRPAGCAILFTFPLQQWLHERSSTLRNKYLGCHVSINIHFPLNKYPTVDGMDYHVQPA